MQFFSQLSAYERLQTYQWQKPQCIVPHSLQICLLRSQLARSQINWYLINLNLYRLLRRKLVDMIQILVLHIATILKVGPRRRMGSCHGSTLASELVLELAWECALE